MLYFNLEGTGTEGTGAGTGGVGLCDAMDSILHFHVGLS